MDRNRWLIFAGVCIVLIGMLVYFNRGEQVDVGQVNGAGVISGEQEGTFEDNVYGNRESDVVLIEYGDFQCPGCGGAAAPLKTLKEEYRDEIAFVYRHFPLTSIHPNALATATVSEAAGNQGKFWEMHDLLFERQSQWENADANARNQIFEDYATELALDMEQFRADLTSETIADKIAFHRALGAKADVSSTPTLILNGEKLPSSTVSNISSGDGSEIRQKIDEALAKEN